MPVDVQQLHRDAWQKVGNVEVQQDVAAVRGLVVCQEAADRIPADCVPDLRTDKQGQALTTCVYV